ncbi:TolC family protein [Methylobacterium sp. NMS12]|uniref:TolC family protein n=1 Tax=Methylobacterium sp. NMS12 TaxID=3079766 RepID=UPI003F885B0C
MVSFAPRRCGRATAWLAASLGLSACAVGPNYVAPEAPPVGRYTREPLQNPSAADKIRTRQGGSADQSFVSGADIPGSWWTLFHSKALNRLVEQALANNPTLEAAQASLRVAQQNVLAQKGTLYPSLTATPQIQGRWRPASTCNRPSTTRPSISTACPRRRRWSRTIRTCSAGTAGRSSPWRPPPRTSASSWKRPT